MFLNSKQWSSNEVQDETDQFEKTNSFRLNEFDFFLKEQSKKLREIEEKPDETFSTVDENDIFNMNSDEEFIFVDGNDEESE